MAGKSNFDPQLVFDHEYPEMTHTYTERDVALYALGVGACSRDAVDDKELKYVYHQHGQHCIQVLPTFATLFCFPLQPKIAGLPGLEFDHRLLLHGEQYIEIHRPLPSSGVIINKAAVAGLHDKGKAAIVEVEILSYEKESHEPICMNRMSFYVRGAGGFSKSSEPYSCTKYPSSQAVAYNIPKRQPFAIFEECTQPSQALLYGLYSFNFAMKYMQPQQYALTGDYNPLHLDPKIAEAAGKLVLNGVDNVSRRFCRPILHGLCTLGFAVRAIIKSIRQGDQDVIKSISGRFLMHVYPGETLLTEMWLEGLRVVYQVKVKERNRVVLSGVVTLDRVSSSL